MSAERRNQKRIPVEMWVEEVRDRETYFQRSANLSEGGLYLDGTIPHPRGTVVQLRFTLPGEDGEVAIRGQIVGDPDEERLGMHVRFLDDERASPSWKRIKAFVDKSA